MIRTVRTTRRSAATGVLLTLLLVGALLDLQLALTMAPGLLMLALFARGVHPGERLLRRLANTGRPVARAVSSPRPRLAVVIRPAGRELASALAMRPPPAQVA